MSPDEYFNNCTHIIVAILGTYQFGIVPDPVLLYVL